MINWTKILPDFTSGELTFFITAIVILIIYIIVAKRFLSPSAWRHSSGVFFILLWGYLFISVTVFNRTLSEETYDLKIFWTVKEAWSTRQARYWYYIIGNIGLFIPLGFALPLAFTSMQKIWKSAGIAFCLSTIVETIQLVFHLGLFELDDLLHNTVGAILGYAIYVILRLIHDRKSIRMLEIIISLAIIAIYLVFLGYALYSNQPVFDYFFM